jgi:hypothetical protein
MNPTTPHVRVGQAWTAYVRSLVIGLVIGLSGVAALGVGLFANSAAQSEDPAATVAAVLPVPAPEPAKPARHGSHPKKPEATTPPPQAITAADRQHLQDGAGRMVLGGAALVAVAALFLGYRVLLIRSRVLFTDDSGVWFHEGVLPWARGTRGVKWRDLEGAAVFTGFASWLLRSSTVRVSHRFTKSSEIVVGHVPRGALVAGAINELHHRLLLDPDGRLGIDAPR